MTRKQAAEDRRRLWRDIERGHRREAKEKLASLRGQIRAARIQRKGAMKDAAERCRAERIGARERARLLRVRALEQLRDAMKAERLSARSACTLRKGEVRSTSAGDVARSRGELAAEKKYQSDLRRINRSNATRRGDRPRATSSERRSESDDEVRANISPEFMILFERVKRSIKASSRQTRTEAFFKYVEDHPHELLQVLDDQTEKLVRDLERQEREMVRAARRPTPRVGYSPAQESEVPF